MATEPYYLLEILWDEKGLLRPIRLAVPWNGGLPTAEVRDPATGQFTRLNGDGFLFKYSVATAYSEETANTIYSAMAELAEEWNDRQQWLDEEQPFDPSTATAEALLERIIADRAYGAWLVGETFEEGKRLSDLRLLGRSKEQLRQKRQDKRAVDQLLKDVSSNNPTES